MSHWKIIPKQVIWGTVVFVAICIPGIWSIVLANQTPGCTTLASLTSTPTPTSPTPTSPTPVTTPTAPASTPTISTSIASPTQKANAQPSKANTPQSTCSGLPGIGSSLIWFFSNATVDAAFIAALAALVGTVGGGWAQIQAARIQNQTSEIKNQNKTLEDEKAQLQGRYDELEKQLKELKNRYQGSTILPADLPKYKQSADDYVANLAKDSFFARTGFRNIQIETADIYTGMKVRAFPLSPRLDRKLEIAARKHNLDILLDEQDQLLKTDTHLAQDWSSMLQTAEKQHILLGGPKAGKTTLLKYLALNAKNLNNAIELPIYINLSVYASSQYFDATFDTNTGISMDMDPEVLKDLQPMYSELRGFIGFIARDLQGKLALTHNEICKYVHQTAMDGKVCFLLDGLEQAATKDFITGNPDPNADTTLKRIIRVIEQMAGKYKASYIFVALRTAALRYMGENGIPHLFSFNPLEILDLSSDITNDFIDKLPDGKAGAADTLKIRLKQDLRLRNLATNPLFLADIVHAIIDSGQQNVYKNHYTIFQALFNMLLPEEPPDGRENGIKRRFLRKLAWYLHISKKYYFEKEDLEYRDPDLSQVVERDSRGNMSFEGVDIMTLLNDLIIYHGLLLKKVNERKYCFSYPCLQEFCAAEYVTHTRSLLDELLRYSSDAWWMEVLLLYAQDLQIPVEKLIELAHTRYATAPLLAGHCFTLMVCDDQCLLPQEAIPKLCDTLIKTKYQLHHEQMIRAIETIPPDWSSDHVRQEIQQHCICGDATLQILTEALSTVDKRCIAFLLLPIFAVTNDAATHDSIAHTLTRTTLQEILLALIDIVQTNTFSDEIRIHIAHSIGLQQKHITDDTIPTALVGLLTQPPISPDIGWSIVMALGHLAATVNIADYIKQKLEDIYTDPNTDLHIRWDITYALAQLNNDSDKANERYRELLALERELSAADQQALRDALQARDDIAMSSVVLRLLESPLSRRLRQRLVCLPGQWCTNPLMIYQLDNLRTSNADIADNIYNAMWSIDRRIRG